MSIQLSGGASGATGGAAFMIAIVTATEWIDENSRVITTLISMSMFIGWIIWKGVELHYKSRDGRRQDEQLELNKRTVAAKEEDNRVRDARISADIYLKVKSKALDDGFTEEDIHSVIKEYAPDRRKT